VPDVDLGNYFAGADFINLTYSSSFHSQSGVLHIAANARKPILASASLSPMIEAVTRFHLGVAVEPDSKDAIIGGMRRLIKGGSVPDWDGYEASASWDRNAKIVLEAAGITIKTYP